MAHGFHPLMKNAILSACLLLPLTGCVHSRNLRIVEPPEVGNPQLLYLHPEPHRSLYVELDAVQGAAPSETEVCKVQAFLQQWCDKPHGIVIAASSVISRSAARGKSALTLARQYMDGPPASTNAAPSAFLYILFYDNRLNRPPLQSPKSATPQPAWDRPALGLGNPENPHVVLFPYPAMIYMDRSWLGGLVPEKYAGTVHEAAHVLGLVRRATRIKGHHCSTPWCCMASLSQNISSDIGARLRRQKPRPDFCDACTAELRTLRESTVESTMRFVGPVLVRNMGSYQVLSLPGACRLYIGDSRETGIAQFLEQWRHPDPSILPEEELWFSGRAESSRNVESLFPAIEAAKQDPVPPIRNVAIKLEQSLRLEISKNRRE